MVFMEYGFEWDPAKARQNWGKHGVRFELGATIFRDPHALTVYDPDHSDEEDRWVTMGSCSTGMLVVVHHTFLEESKDFASIRIISCRKATKTEQRQYRAAHR